MDFATTHLKPGELIQQRRLERGLSLRTIAVSCGISEERLEEIEECNRKRPPTVEELEPLAVALNIYRPLLGLDPPKPPSMTALRMGKLISQSR